MFLPFYALAWAQWVENISLRFYWKKIESIFKPWWNRSRRSLKRSTVSESMDKIDRSDSIFFTIWSFDHKNDWFNWKTRDRIPNPVNSINFLKSRLPRLNYSGKSNIIAILVLFSKMQNAMRIHIYFCVTVPLKAFRNGQWLPRVSYTEELDSPVNYLE